MPVKCQSQKRKTDEEYLNKVTSQRFICFQNVLGQRSILKQIAELTNCLRLPSWSTSTSGSLPRSSTPSAARTAAVCTTGIALEAAKFGSAELSLAGGKSRPHWPLLFMPKVKMSPSFVRATMCALPTTTLLKDRNNKFKSKFLQKCMSESQIIVLASRVRRLIFELIIKVGGLDSRDQSRSRSRTSIVSRLTFENRRDYPSCRDQLFFYLGQDF